MIIILSTVIIKELIENNKKEYYSKYEERLDQINQDDVEIERKWLIDKNNIPYNLEAENIKIFI